jgi:hypothetical protein
MSRYRAAPGALAAAVEDGTVVLDMRSNRYFTLNETGAFVWGLLERGATESEIVERVTEEFEVAAAEAEAAVRELLDTLRERQLVESEEEQ